MRIRQLWQEFHTLHLNWTGFKPIRKCNFQLGQGRVSHALLNMNGIQTHSKKHSPAEWRVSHAPLNMNGIQTHSKM